MKKHTLNHSIEKEHEFELLKIEGDLPTDLVGTLYRTGPGLLERFGRRVPHPFDADGAVTAIRFKEGKAFSATKIVKSPEFLQEEKLGRFQYGTLAPWHSVLMNNLKRKVKSTGNTNILSWNNRLFALMEMSKPIEIDPDNINTGSVQTFNGEIQGAFSAHPHRVESLKTIFNFGVRGDKIDLFSLPDKGEMNCFATISAPWEGMIHDFIATDKHLIFFIGPAKLIRWRAFLGIGDLSQYFKWEPESGMRILIVPIKDPSRTVQLMVDAFWIWHFVNAYEENGEIIVDAIRHDNFGAFEAPSSAGPEQSTPSLHRFYINPELRKMRDESLWKTPCEFPCIHPLYSGAKNKYIYLQTFKNADQLGGGVAQFEIESKQVKRWTAPKGHLECEPIFVPSGVGETDGYILQLIQDPEIRKSYLAILDAKNLENGLKAKVWLNEAIPMTFHGVFVRDMGK